MIKVKLFATFLVLGILAISFATFASKANAAKSAGTLLGKVTITNLCRFGLPCDTSGAYLGRFVTVCPKEHGSISSKPNSALNGYLVCDPNSLIMAPLDSNGNYSTPLEVGSYYVNFGLVGAERSSDVPVEVKIKNNTTTTLNISVDSGLR